MPVETILMFALGTIAVILLGLIIVLVAVVRRQAIRANYLKHLVEPYEAAVGSDGRFEQDGRRFDIVLHGKSKRFPIELKLGTDCFSAGSFKVTREGFLEKLFKGIRVSSEIQTGDSLFDATCYISTETEPFAASYFGMPEKRGAILDLMEMGFREVRLDGKQLCLRLHTQEMAQKPPTSLLNDAAVLMSNLATDIPVHVQRSTHPATISVSFKQWSVIGGASAILLAGIVAVVWADAFFWPLSPWTVFLDSLKYTLAPLGIFMFLAVMLLKGRSSSHLEIIAAVTIAMVGFPMAGFGTEIIINGEFDTAPIITHKVNVTRKYTQVYKTSTTYWTEVESWRSQVETEEVAFPRHIWEGIQPGTTLLFCDTKPGRLGYEWLLGCNVQGHISF